jgi:hypothetical protein
MMAKRTRKSGGRRNSRRAATPALRSELKPDATARTKAAVARFKEKHGGDSCGDAIAKKMAKLKTKEGAVDIASLRKLAERNGCWKAVYSDLNSGRLRMVIGNLLRAKSRRGDTVKWEA